ncbi:hypothetical protein PENSPDRAFT_580821 [Peniophora sp. CONT]|nr:hypothetical protein PENSPDRAFT_580821 [Peniophora sp. CONT]
MASPRKSTSNSSGSSTPRSLPTTPVRPRSGYAEINRSPLLLPSQSASIPFDWDAARGLKEAPYSPRGSTRKARHSEVGVGMNGPPGTPGRKRERVVRKKGLIERIQNLPSRIAFEISIFPANVPFPETKTAANILGGGLHFLHFCVRVAQVRDVPDTNTGWEDMYREDKGSSYFDWTTLLTILLVGAALANALILFTHTKIYHLHSQTNPVASPHARFVKRPESTPPLTSRIRTHLWRSFVSFWRFLLNMSGSNRGASKDSSRRVQELEVWDPSELELALFCVYSPMHALLWMLWNPVNWIMIMFVMGCTAVQLRALVTTYEAKLKDRAIISAEVMHEYEERFVNPRVNPIRKDASVMTHESEMVGHR